MQIADGISDQEAFNTLNRMTSALGINFVFPLTPVDRPVIIVHVDKTA
jgi:hypothetical protein